MCHLVSPSNYILILCRNEKHFKLIHPVIKYLAIRKALEMVVLSKLQYSK